MITVNDSTIFALGVLALLGWVAWLMSKDFERMDRRREQRREVWGWRWEQRTDDKEDDD